MPPQATLPAPAVAATRKLHWSPPDATSSLRIRWGKLKRAIGTALPDEDPTNTETTSDAGSHLGWKATGTGEAKNSENEADDLVDEVVVDNSQTLGMWARVQPSSSTDGRAGETGTSPGTAGGDPRGGGGPSDSSSNRNTAFDVVGPLGKVGTFCRWRVWPVLVHFFSPRYHDDATEEAYQKECWFTGKSTVIFGSCFLVLNWVFLVTLLPHPWSTFNMVQNYGVGPLLSLPLVPMAMFDFPRKYQRIWQVILFFTVWSSASAAVLDMHLCNYYIPELRDCGNRDFLSTSYYATALPVIGLFALGQTRIFSLCGTVLWLALVAGAIFPARPAFVRNFLNTALFQGFVLFTHYRREAASRRMYMLQNELKVQFRAKQKAQINERKTMDAKRRFSSYIFHEVRVPLHTALLAVQNLEGANIFDKNSDQAVEYAALEGSLQMMSQVLNDVLDFSRMEKGGFSSVCRPFSFHQTMRSIFGPLKLDANARGLELETSLDCRIDEVATKAAYQESDCQIIGEGSGIVMGDEMRLRQVINNLCSNACKFSTAGGKITVTTTLIYPTEPYPSYSPGSGSGEDDRGASTSDGSTGTYSPRLSAGRLQQHDTKTGETTNDQTLVIRIEIKDTGVGIRPRDMVEGRLFSPYVQTEVGRQQGGKGTGLGLSLVRQIVMLSGGRLGVKSRVGEGSTFWTELPFGIGPRTLKVEHPETRRRGSSMLDKDLSTPSSIGGESASEYRFLPSLQRGASDHLTRVEEIAPPVNIELHPTAYRFSPGRPAAFEDTTTIQPYSMSSAADAAPQVEYLVAPNSNASTEPTSSAPFPSPPLSLTNSNSSLRPSPFQPLQFADGPIHTLIVDDDSLTRRLMARMLMRIGCTVETAENGAVALEMLLKRTDTDGNPVDVDHKHFDCTFLDNQMPVCSGLEVVQRLRSLGRDDLVIGLTANALLEDQRHYLAQGASYVLTKPVLELDLRHYLVKADERRSESRRLALATPRPSVAQIGGSNPLDPAPQ